MQRTGPFQPTSVSDLTRSLRGKRSRIPVNMELKSGVIKPETAVRAGTGQTRLTRPVHAHAAVAAVLAGSAVSRRHHELPLAVGRGAVEVTGVAGDMNIII